MIIFFGAFLVIVAISLVLAYRSMKDFHDIPSRDDNGIYLIQSPEALTSQIIVEIGNKARGEICSFERLFRGSQSALIIFGSKRVLEVFPQLNLLELEDYTAAPVKLAWEMGIKDGSLDYVDNPFGNLPVLRADEQFWWQLLLQSQNQDRWQAQIRAVLVTNDLARQKQLAPELAQLSKVVKIPRPLGSGQIYQQYTTRALIPQTHKPLLLKSDQILKLLGKI